MYILEDAKNIANKLGITIDKFSPEEFLETAINNKKEKDSLDDDEEIIGTVIKSKKNK